MSNAREKYMLALANFVNGSELGYEDRSSIPQYKKDIEDYVYSLEKVNQKYKEVFEKIKTRYICYYGTTKEMNDNSVLRNVLREISDILKEVE